MRLRPLAAAFATATSVLLGTIGLNLTASPALAAGSCGVTISNRIVMDAPYKKVPVTYGNDCVASQAYASWQVTSSVYGEQDYLSYDQTAGDDRFDYFEMYDWLMPLGSYTLDPQGASSQPDFIALYQNTPATTIKLGTRVALQVTRSGGRAYFRTTTSAYSPAHSAFARYPNALVAVQYMPCATCVWTTLGMGYTDSTAAWSFSIASTKSFNFRSVLYSGPKTWDAQGPAMFR